MAAPLLLQVAGQIPIDYTVRMTKGYFGLSGGDLTFYDASGNLVFQVRSFDSSSHQWIKTLLDPLGNAIISAVYHDGGWQGFRGNSRESKDLIFNVQRHSQSSFNTELEVFLMSDNLAKPSLSFRLKGSPFQRSCTIYMGNSIVAQTSLMYKLRWKFVYSRHKFRLTVYPGIDHTLVVALVVIFFCW